MGHASAASSRAPSPTPLQTGSGYIQTRQPCPWLHGHTPTTVFKVLSNFNAVPIPSSKQACIDAHIRTLIERFNLEDPLYCLDLGCVLRLYNSWQLAMPRVHPFYAVKCNTDAAMIALLAALGAGFDCASEAEVKQVLAAGVTPDRIVYANACKRPKDIRAAAALGVDLTTFDTPSELHKLHRLHPHTAALLRIRADDPAARCQLGNKYGAEMEAVPGLLQTAQALHIKVTGVSFHVGSGATNPAAFAEAIALAREVFDQALALGFDMHILDIGGGFSGGTIDADGSVGLGAVPAAVNDALRLHFADEQRVRVIAEPGRYFAEASASLACMVIGVRDVGKHADKAAGQSVRDYWITDGIYGSMNSLLYDHATLTAHQLPLASSVSCPGDSPTMQSHANDEPEVNGQTCLLPSTVFGLTCDGLDTVLRDYPLPCMENGDWLVFPNMGAYTLVGACDFNGIEASATQTYYVCSEM